MRKEPRKKPLNYDHAKPRGYDARQVATYQFVCQVDDEKLAFELEISTTLVASLKAESAWGEQVGYLTELEASAPLDLATLFASKAAYDAVLRAVSRAPKPYQEQMLRWCWHQILDRLQLPGGARDLEACLNDPRIRLRL